MARLIDMPYGLWARVGPSNHVLDGGPDPPGKLACSGMPPIGIFSNTMRCFIELLRYLVAQQTVSEHCMDVHDVILYNACVLQER